MISFRKDNAMLLKDFEKLSFENKMKFFDQYLLPVKQVNNEQVFCRECRYFSEVRSWVYSHLCKKNEKCLVGIVNSPIERNISLYDYTSQDEYELLYKKISCEYMNSNNRCSYFEKATKDF